MIKSISIYSASSLLSAAISFLLIPFMTRYLEPSGYGILSITTSLVTAGQIFGLSLNGYLSRAYLIEKNNIQNAFRSVIYISSISFFTLSMLIYTFSDFISAHSGLPTQWLPIVPALVIFQFYIMAYLAICQASEHVTEFAVLQIAQATLLAILTLVFIIVFDWDWKGRVLGLGLTSGIFFLIIQLRLSQRKLVSFSIKRTSVTEPLRFGTGLFPYQLGGFISNYSDRFFIANLLDGSELGLYTAALQITSIFLIFTDSVNKAYTPWLYNKLTNSTTIQKWHLVKRIYALFGVLLLMAVIVYCIISLTSPIIFGGKYISSDKYFIWLIIGYWFSGMQNMVTNLIFFSNKTHYLSFASITAGIINVIAIPILIKANGAIGVAQALLITNSVMFFLSWYFSNKACPMPWAGLK
jgi:O-antigen/teichoic acid export membrane protein